MPLAIQYIQELNPLGHRTLSTIVAALPVLSLFYLLVVRRWIASVAGGAAALVAVAIAWLVYGMPAEMAGWSFVHGSFFGLLPIGWTVFAAMLLYNVTVETGQFAVIRSSIGNLSGDARVQSILIGFAFGALMEGAAGSGSPVAICGAMLVGLGVPPFQAAVICLIANTSPVCYGGLGVPILTLGNVSGINPETISVMCGHQLPFLSFLIPLYMIKCMCTWRETLAIWPAILVGGGSFAMFQYFFATMHLWIPGFSIWPLTDVGGGLFSLATLVLFLRFCWRPKKEWRFAGEPRGLHNKHLATKEQSEESFTIEPSVATHEMPRTLEILSTKGILLAWSPFLLMAVCLACAGILRQKESHEKRPLEIGALRTTYELEVPVLHNEVERAERLVPPGTPPDKRRESAIFKFPWATAPGTPVFIAAIISMLFLRTTKAQVIAIFRRTFVQMKVPIPTIACMLGLSYVTKYSGIDATLGVALAETGAFYPFFAAILGWLGVFLTGTDAGSNALFGSLQKITATEVYSIYGSGVMSNLSLEQAQVLICTANSTGGVMGKMIDAQSICVATAGTNQIGREADLFKAVVKHSIFLASVVGAMTAIQAFIPPFTRMVPHP